MTRPAASGGATDGQREVGEWEAERAELNRLARKHDLDNHHNAALCPYCSPAAVASQADGKLREALKRLIEVAPVMQHGNGYPARAVPIAELLMLLDRRVLGDG